MSSRIIGRELDCLGSRATYWLKQRFVNWPVKAVSRETGIDDATLTTWWQGKCKPSSSAITKLFTRYPEMVPFVMEPWLAPSWPKMVAKLREAKKLLEDLEWLKP